MRDSAVSVINLDMEKVWVGHEGPSMKDVK
jgi:hypothetical protein